MSGNITVSELLSKWGLQLFDQAFKVAGVNKEVFDDESMMIERVLPRLIDPIKECGYFELFKKRYEEYKTDCNLANHNPINNDPNNTTNNHVPNEASLPMQSSQSNNHQHSNSHPSSEINSQNSTAQQLPKLSISDLLRQHHSIIGDMTVAKFQQRGEIDYRKLSDMVILYEMNYTQSYSIKSARFQELADECAKIFRTNVPVDKIKLRFYYPSQPSSKGKGKVKAGGVFYEKYVNIRRQLIDLNLISEAAITPDDELEQIQLGHLEETVKWLQKNDTPQAEVVEKWKSTVDTRNKPGKTLKNYFLLYKGLRSDYGHILLTIDFDHVHPELPSINDHWLDVSLLLLQAAERKGRINNFIADLCANDKHEVAGFFIITNLLGAICKRKSTGDTFGNTPEEVQKSFIYNAQTKQEFDDLKILRKAIYERNNNFKIGPYIVLIGDLKEEGNIDADIEVVLVIEGYEYKITSKKLTDAVEYCMKATKFLQIDFAAESKHIWTFILEYVYCLKTKRVYAKVDDLITFLNKLSEENQALLYEAQNQQDEELNDLAEQGHEEDLGDSDEQMNEEYLDDF